MNPIDFEKKSDIQYMNKQNECQQFSRNKLYLFFEQQQPVNIGFQEPMGIGRGMFMKNQSNVSMPPSQPVPDEAFGYSDRNGVDLPDDYAPLRLPGQTAPPRRFDDVEEQSSTSESS